jgi:hypothetical protein
MTLILLTSIFVSAIAGSAEDLSRICATTKSESQILKGELICGETHIVRDVPLSFKHRDGFQVFLSVGSIFELSKDGHQLRVSRGNAVVRGSMLGKSLIIQSPLAQAMFVEGAMLLSVDQKTRTTRIGSVAGALTVRNRLDGRAFVKIEPSEMTELSPVQTSIHPHRPAPMAVATVRSIVASVGLSQEESDEFASNVASERERRERHFAEYFEGWRGLKIGRVENRTLASPVSVDSGRKLQRSIASVPTVDPAEQARFEKQWNEHILGEMDQNSEKLLRPVAKRKPASTVQKTKSVEGDPLFKEEKARLLDVIQGGNYESLDPDRGHRHK